MPDRLGPADAVITAVAAAWRAVPRGATRRRRERELVAELYGRVQPRQAAEGVARLASRWTAESVRAVVVGRGRR